ncbi:MAG: hypothetical protein NXI22_03420 [bacterium]|nr:hypothetical protein [bacterium]
MAAFVRRLVEQRRFLSESDVLSEGLRLLHARESLQQEVAQGFSELARGEAIAAEDVYQKAEKRIAEIEAQNGN